MEEKEAANACVDVFSSFAEYAFAASLPYYELCFSYYDMVFMCNDSS